jgi:hypothetical protein
MAGVGFRVRDRRRYRQAVICVTTIIALGIILLLVRRPILRAAGWVLVTEDPLKQADVIVLPQWAEDAGALEAADLVHQGVSSRVAVLVESPDPADVELVKRGLFRPDHPWIVQLLLSLGVRSVEEIPNSVDGTTSEGPVLENWCKLHPYRTVLIVSTPDHSRRLHRVLRRSMQGTGTETLIRNTRYSAFDPDRWWQTRGGIRTEVEELEKLLLDVVRNPLG